MFSDRYFLQHALLTGILASISCGVVGTLVVVRRITYLAGGIAHTVFAGLGAALYLEKTGSWPGLSPIYGAIASALIAAVIISIVSLKAREREDTVIGALWAVGMALGILFISRTPGYNTDLMSYLFGNILMVSGDDLKLLALLDLVVVLTTALFYNQFVAVCFDSEFAELRGLKVGMFYTLLLCVTALTIVVLITAVGIVLVIALLTLPSAIAATYCRTIRATMVLSCVLCAAFTIAGLALSYNPNLPPGATTIVIAGTAYLGVISLRKALDYPRPLLRRGCCGTQYFSSTVAQSVNLANSQSRPSPINLSMSDS